MKTKYWYWIWKTFLGPSRLRKRFIKTFLLAGLVPLILMGTVSFFLIQQTHKRDVFTLEQNLATQVGTEVTRSLDIAASRFELRVTFDAVAPIAFDQQGFILEDILRELPAAVEASFICTTPRQCIFGTETSRWMRNGAVVEPITELRDRSNEPSFEAARRGTDAIFGPATAHSDGKLVIPIAAPVLNKDGAVIAVLAGTLNVHDQLQEIIGNAKLGAGGYVYLISADGTIVAHPNVALTGTNIAGTPIESIVSGTRYGSLQYTSYDSLDGIPVSGAGSMIENTEFTVVAEWPDAETRALTKTILAQIGGFAVLAFVLLAAISSWMAFRLIQPIAQLRQGTSIIGAGNFDYRVDISTGDELEDLGTNLNRMAQNLKGLEELHDLRLRTELLSENLRKEQELSKLKDQFITTVSHQFNTPLSVIGWSLDALTDPNATPEKIHETADVIRKSQRDIASIVSDLVTLSEIGFRYQRSNTKPINIEKLTRTVLESFSEPIKLKQLTVTMSSSGDTVAEVNEFMLRKAIENLVDNAIAYSNSGGRVAISIGGDEHELRFTISDEGIGIPRAEQSRIFQQFFRAKNAVAKKNVGTGLGLYITKNIVEGHGGSINFKSEENNGALFSVTLPRKAAPTEHEQSKP
jgi:signal transduction histidine kinase